MRSAVDNHWESLSAFEQALDDFFSFSRFAMVDNRYIDVVRSSRLTIEIANATELSEQDALSRVRDLANFCWLCQSAKQTCYEALSEAYIELAKR